MQILSRRTKNNPVLIGEPGVGKSAIVEGLAQLIVEGSIPEILRGKRVVSLDLAGMLAGAKYRGEFEERLKKAMAEIDVYKRQEGFCPLVRAVAEGGDTRQASVVSGLRALPEDCEIVAIHDAARPFVTVDILSRSIELARQTGSGVACAMVVDTVKEVGEDGSVPVSYTHLDVYKRQG